MGKHFHHVVLFRVHDGGDPEHVRHVLDAARPTSGLISWHVERSIDERKGSVVAEIAVFESAEAFRSWRDSELHQEAAAQVRELADWLVADWM
jgi:heme-degrading monooxygenase HmoA